MGVKKKKVKRGAPKKSAKTVRVDRKELAKQHEETHRAIARQASKPTPPLPPEPIKKAHPLLQVDVRSVYYDGQYLPGLCFHSLGTPVAQVVVGSTVEGIRHFEVNEQHYRKSDPVEHGHGIMRKPYPIELFAKHMRTLALNGVPIDDAAYGLLAPLIPDLPMPKKEDTWLAADEAIEKAVVTRAARPAATPAPTLAEPAARVTVPRIPARMLAPEANRTSGKELVRELAAKAKLPPEKVRAALRAAGLRAPYTDAAACRKALGIK
jgi:hypothetical protein